jgi:hypothetical protein
MIMRRYQTVSIAWVALAVSALAAAVSAAEPTRHTEVSIDGDSFRIIFDTDMGSDCDDAGALAVLHVYADRGLAEIVGCIYSSGKVPYGAGVVEAGYGQGRIYRQIVEDHSTGEHRSDGLRDLALEHAEKDPRRSAA